MHVRFLGLGLLVVFLGLAGALFSLPWLIGDPVPVVRPDARMTFPSNGDPVAQFQANAAGDFVLLARVPATQAAPRILFAMQDHDMPAIEPEAQPLGGGLFRAEGRLPMAGRWQLRIASNEAVREFDFVLSEF